jgi:hypothetical protein
MFYDADVLTEVINNSSKVGMAYTQEVLMFDGHHQCHQLHPTLGLQMNQN